MKQQIHTQSDVTIAFLTRDPDLNGQDRPSCEFGVSNQRRNTNHIYANLTSHTTGAFSLRCKVTKIFQLSLDL